MKRRSFLLGMVAAAPAAIAGTHMPDRIPPFVKEGAASFQGMMVDLSEVAIDDAITYIPAAGQIARAHQSGK